MTLRARLVARETQPVIWKPHPGFQTRFLQSSADECFGGGAAGPGKTDALLYGGLRFIDQPWCHELFLRRSYPELQEVMDRAMRAFPRLGGEWLDREKRWTFPSGATYEFGYAERYADLMRYDGREFTGLRWDELGHVPEERWWLYLITRLRSPHPEAVLRARASGMPGGVGNAWIRRRFVDPCGREGGAYTIDLEVSPGVFVKHRIQYVPGKLAENPTIDNPANRRYRANLMKQPENIRRALLEGDWESAEGLAFSELSWASHGLPRGFEVPHWWVQWGGFDWGFQHWAVFVWLARDDAGVTYVVDTLWMRRLHPDQLAEGIWESIPVDRLSLVYAGHDCWAEHRARGIEGPTIAETFINRRIPLQQADIRRGPGCSLVRDLVSFRRRGLQGEDVRPRLLFLDTPGNRRLVTQLEGLVVDPDNPEDVLKVNSDPASGEGGDDGYDGLRYAVLSHEPKATRPKEHKSAWDPEVLQHEYERTHRSSAVGRPPDADQGKEGAWW